MRHRHVGHVNLRIDLQWAVLECYDNYLNESKGPKYKRKLSYLQYNLRIFKDKEIKMNKLKLKLCFTYHTIENQDFTLALLM